MMKIKMNVLALGVAVTAVLGMTGCRIFGAGGASFPHPLPGANKIASMPVEDRADLMRVFDSDVKESKDCADYWNNRLSYHYQDYDKETIKTFLLYREAWTQAERTYRLAQKKLECPESIDDAEYDAQVEKYKWLEEQRMAEDAEVAERAKK